MSVTVLDRSAVLLVSASTTFSQGARVQSKMDLRSLIDPANMLMSAVAPAAEKPWDQEVQARKASPSCSPPLPAGAVGLRVHRIRSGRRIGKRIRR